MLCGVGVSFTVITRFVIIINYIRFNVKAMTLVLPLLSAVHFAAIITSGQMEEVQSLRCEKL
jgi:hypothetical protein